MLTLKHIALVIFFIQFILLATPQEKDNREKDFLIAVDEGNISLVKTLIVNKININATNSLGNTALIIAIARQREDIVKELITAGVDINLPNKHGLKPILVASLGKNIEIIKSFIFFENAQ